MKLYPAKVGERSLTAGLKKNGEEGAAMVWLLKEETDKQTQNTATVNFFFILKLLLGQKDYITDLSNVFQ